MQQNASLVNVCQGESLAAVSMGCVDAEACQLAAVAKGLKLGDSVAFEGEGEGVDKGCYFFPEDHQFYPNEVFFGGVGTCSEMRITPRAGAQRVSCDGTTLPPFDPTRCPGELCISMEGCREAALAMGLKLGNTEDPFAGDYPIKGCTYFPADDPLYPGEAYWGTGASICGQLRADPPDGSIRLGCVDFEELLETEAPEDTEAFEELGATEETGAPEEDEALEETEASDQTALDRPRPTQAPVSRPVQIPEMAFTNSTFATEGFNETSPSMAPSMEDELNENDEEDKADKEDRPSNVVAALETAETASAASKMQIGWVLSVLAAIPFSLS
jgi:hypothetical protein